MHIESNTKLTLTNEDFPESSMLLANRKYLDFYHILSQDSSEFRPFSSWRKNIYQINFDDVHFGMEKLHFFLVIPQRIIGVYSTVSHWRYGKSFVQKEMVFLCLIL